MDAIGQTVIQRLSQQQGFTLEDLGSIAGMRRLLISSGRVSRYVDLDCLLLGELSPEEVLSQIGKVLEKVIIEIQAEEKDMDIEKDQAAMLPSGDFDRLDKREREEFHAMQERMVQFLIRASNEFQLQYPNLDVRWRFQAEVYQTVQVNPSTVRYSNRIY